MVRATVTSRPSAAGQTPRLYFRWREHEDFYWVAMEAEPGGRFWAIPPKPEMRNEQIEFYGALVDATGKVVARSESQIAQVTKDCKVELSPKERGVAENLTVGETSPKQQGKKVLAFLCDGVVTRINSRRRPPLRRGLPGLRRRLVAAQGGAHRSPSPASSASSSPTRIRSPPPRARSSSPAPGPVLSPLHAAPRTLECGRAP